MDLLAGPERARELARSSRLWPSVALAPGQLSELELLLNGSLAPLTGYMGREACEVALAGMRLPDGTFWPVPIVLEVSAERAEAAIPGAAVALREPEGAAVAVLHVAERWAADESDRVRLAGRVEGLALPVHRDFRDLRRTPAQVRAEIARRRWTSALAWQTEALVHRAHVEATVRAARGLDGGLLLQPALPSTGPADDREHGRVRCYRAAAAAYPERGALLALLPWSRDLRRFHDAPDIALRAIIARNHGCTHILVSDEEAAAIAAAAVTPEEIGLGIVVGAGAAALSDEAAAAGLAAGTLDDRFTYPAVAEELRRMFPPRARRGLTLFFTGLSGSGKSTIANAVRTRLLERGGRRITLLDGDLVRQHLSSELGFSREHREINVRRIGFVAAEITRHGGLAICAPIAPYDTTRRDVRREVERAGGFVLVFVDTPLEVCEGRDPKGLYARARAGVIPEFTGVSDPYEPPADAEITIRTTEVGIDDAADLVVSYLEREGYVAPAGSPA